ncbi:unnamed protein product, partial [marine sediment metagenome]
TIDCNTNGLDDDGHKNNALHVNQYMADNDNSIIFDK